MPKGNGATLSRLSAYARQFIGQMDKPRYDMIRGLSPTISIDQKAASRNPRSTVGTITEISDYLRVLYARIGEQFCLDCGKPVGRGNAQDMVDQILGLPVQTKIMLLAPIVENRKGGTSRPIEEAPQRGIRARADRRRDAVARRRAETAQAEESTPSRSWWIG